MSSLVRKARKYNKTYPLGIVIKNTILINMDNASVQLRKMLLESCNLHTKLDLPGGTFTGAGVKTLVLFFEKGIATKR